MESNWRYNVFDLVGYKTWNIVGLYDYHILLVARLIVPVVRFGVVYTHIMRIRLPGIGVSKVWARMSPGSNVLNQWSGAILPPGPFPGVAVFPD